MSGAEVVQATIPMLHPGQLRLDRAVDSGDDVYTSAGRRFGKTTWGARRALLACLAKPDTQIGWWAPSYKLGLLGWHGFHRLVWRIERELGESMDRRVRIRETHKVDHYVEFPNGSQFWWMTAESEVSGRGHGFDIVFADEAAWIRTSAFENVIYPSLADRGGQLVPFGTPAGMAGWFYENWTKAKEGESGLRCLQLPSTDNPNPRIAQFVEKARERLPRVVFEQEFLAMFTSDAASLFRGLGDCYGGELEDPQSGTRYSIGLDVARDMTWSVAHVVALTDEPPLPVVHELRIQGLDYPEQADLFADLAKDYNGARVVLDDTGQRGGMLRLLKDREVDTHGYTFTEKSRKDLLDNLANYVSRHDVKIPAELKAGLGHEMRAFGILVDRASGRIKYVSRSGEDDRVMALALAVFGAPLHGESSVVFGTVSNPILTQEY